MYHSTKKYPHSLGLSAAFRQWRASSHCRWMHGYPLAFEFAFSAIDLDAHNWVVDFGSMKPVAEWLKTNFDHRLIIASDDPMLPVFKELHEKDLANINVMPGVGCEMFATHAFGFCKRYIKLAGMSPRVHLDRVTVWEHEANSASYSEPHGFAEV